MPPLLHLETSEFVASPRPSSILLVCFCLAFAGSTVFGNAEARASLIVNGDFEDTSGIFPNGWTPGLSVQSVNTMFGQSAAQMVVNGGSISQRFISTAPQDALANFQLDFAFRTSLAPGINSNQHRMSLLSFNSVNVVTLSFDRNHIKTFSSDGWKNDLLVPDILADTTYFVRLIGRDFDQATKNYTLGFSTDGVNYITGSSTRFHFNQPFGIAIVKFDANTLVGQGLTVDNVAITANSTGVPDPAVVPEPSSGLLFSCAFGLVALARRRNWSWFAGLT